MQPLVSRAVCMPWRFNFLKSSVKNLACKLLPYLGALPLPTDMAELFITVDYLYHIDSMRLSILEIALIV